MATYKDSLVWKEAMNLGTGLYELGQDLPESDRATLGMQLRDYAASIPAEIAVDLLQQHQPRPDFLLRAEAILLIINREYPAIDTTDVEQSLAAIMKRMADPKAFQELSGASADPAR